MRILVNLCGVALAALVGVGCQQSESGAVDSGVSIDEGTPAAAGDATVEAGPSEQAIALDAIPADVATAAHAALEGFEFIRAKREIRKSGLVLYAILGKAGARLVEMEIDAAGKVLEIEDEDDDGGMDDDDDDDDDDDGDDDDDDDDDDDEDDD